MLLQLDIKNIALIEKVSIEMGVGLNVLSGETGAGKSIIIDSINAVLGERVSKDIIRTGEDKAFVEAVFQIDNESFDDLWNVMGMEPEEDGTLILSREITQSGRNICRVNGKMVPLSLLKRIGERLIDIHGQNDNQSLLKTESHIELLDSFGGDSIKQVKEEYLALLEQYKENRLKIKAISGDPGERERKIDLLKFQINEIRSAKLKNNEDELNKQKLLLTNAEKIKESLSVAYNMLTSGEHGEQAAVDSINNALSQLSSITRIDSCYEDIYNRLKEISYQLDDIADDIRKNCENIEYDPKLLEEIEERLDQIFRLKRKYGDTIDEIIAYCERSEEKLEQLEKSEEYIIKLRQEKSELAEKLLNRSRKLNEERRKAAGILESRIGEQLDELEMKNAKFKVSIEFNDTAEGENDIKFTRNGLDRVEFLISPNLGEPLKPLAKIASGGEMSRVMLAIKNILADVDKITTMIFDEIDSGISGRAAQKVGEKLAEISAGHQVICVTHLAQIACMADNNYLIEKVSNSSSTNTNVIKLDRDGKIHEIARLIGGTFTTDSSLKYAEELINSSKTAKQN
jgi:DNA repair protein RecN (Recombination protein N)